MRTRRDRRPRDANIPRAIHTARSAARERSSANRQRWASYMRRAQAPRPASRCAYRRRASSQILLARAPVLGEQRHPDVVAPAPCDPYVAAREPFANESGIARERQRAQVGRLDVRLDAVQLECTKRHAEGEPQALGHVASTGVRGKGVIAEIRTLKQTADDFAQIEDSDNGI